MLKHFIISAVFAVSTIGIQAQSAIELAEDLFSNIKLGYDYQEYKVALANMSYDSLLIELDNDQKKTAFWVNVYNSFAQIQLSEASTPVSKYAFFRKEFIQVAGKSFSLNRIEHGILRHSKIVWARGISKPFPAQYEKDLRVDNPDYRIHFALNAGAVSAPPIYYYEVENLDEQLHQAEEGFINTTTTYNESENTVEVSKIFGWYRKDFGGKSGILGLLKKYNKVPADKEPKLVFRKYDWTTKPKQYQE